MFRHMLRLLKITHIEIQWLVKLAGCNMMQQNGFVHNRIQLYCILYSI